MHLSCAVIQLWDDKSQSGSAWPVGSSQPRKRDDDTISDGFGSAWSAWCPSCGEKTMEIVRPGKVQCGNCG